MIGSANELPSSESGQLPPLKLRPITKIYVGATVAAALFLLAALLRDSHSPTGERVWIALGLIALGAVANRFPLDQAHKRIEYFDVAVGIAAVLIFTPGVAMLLTGTWVFLGAIARARLPGLAAPEIYFNTAQYTLKFGIAALAIRALGWDALAPRFDFPRALLYGLLAGIIVQVVDLVLVSAVIALESRVPAIDVLHDATMAQQWAEIGSLVAQVAVGLLAAMLATYQPWALALLVPIGVAVYLALRQHVDIRHRVEWSLGAGQRVARVGSFDWDLRHGDQRWSDELFRVLGEQPRAERRTTANYLAHVHPDDRDAMQQRFEQAARGEPYEIDHRIVVQSETRHIHSRGTALLDRHGRPRRVIGAVHDITERKRLEERLAHQARHDPLTGLPNRAHFTERLDAAFAEAGRRIPAIAVLFLDLDRFKLINDTFGHEAGDHLLITVGQRLRASVRPEDLVARLGGDEFTVLLTGADMAGAEAAANRIISQVTQRMILPGARDVTIMTSIGIVIPDGSQVTGADLVRDADTALYHAKESGRNQWAWFDARLGAQTRERLALETDLRRALERNEFELRYQPKVELASRRTIGVEAFLRWHHPARGIVPADRFIAIADETGLILEIGAWAIETACREARSWSTGAEDAPWLSVNLSARQFYDPALVTQLKKISTATGFPLARLRLEVAESSLMKSAEATISALDELDEIGVGVIVDDFGTGYSSLPFLQRFAVDTLQLDRSYVLALGTDRNAATVAQAVIGLARGLGMQVVAEGIERPEQLAQLRELGCELGQGNLFLAPSKAAELRALLDSVATPAPLASPATLPAPA